MATPISIIYPSFNRFSNSGVMNLATEIYKAVLLLPTYNPFSKWTGATAIALGEWRISATSWNLHFNKATAVGGAGLTGGTEPIWKTDGGTVVDGDITWTDMGTAIPVASTDELYADIIAYELPGANGYTTGGEQLTALDVNNLRWNSDPIQWIALGTPSDVDFMWVAIYRAGTVLTIEDPLVCLVLIDPTPNGAGTNYETQNMAGGNWALTPHALGRAIFLPEPE